MATRTAVIKYASITKRIIEMKNYSELWIVLGQQTAWDDEDVPDIALPETSPVVEPIIAIKPYISSLAKEITVEAYNLLDDNVRALTSADGVTKYLELVTDVDAYTENARILYLKALVDPINLGHPVHDFRVYYVCSDLVPAAGHEDDSWLAPSNVAGYGLVEYENSGKVVLMDDEAGPACYLPACIEFK